MVKGFLELLGLDQQCCGTFDVARANSRWIEARCPALALGIASVMVIAPVFFTWHAFEGIVLSKG